MEPAALHPRLLAPASERICTINSAIHLERRRTDTEARWFGNGRWIKGSSALK